ncbi:MAG: hypothetical protein WDZ84_10575 [Rhodovibrionaceae bacterium]
MLGLLPFFATATSTATRAGLEEEHIENFPIFYDCPENISQHDSRVTATRHGFPLTTPIGLRQEGVEFWIPAGYLYPWPELLLDQYSSEPVDIKTSSINFAFWMPSGRFPERNPFWFSSYSPCEAGRPPPEDDNFVVRVNLMTPSDSLPGYTRPSQSALSHKYHMSQDATRDLETPLKDVHGLKRYAIVVKGKPHYRYQRLDQYDPEIIITCTDYWTKVLNPSCRAWVYYEPDNLGIHVIFPKRALPDWLRITDMARNLLIKWENGN